MQLVFCRNLVLLSGNKTTIIMKFFITTTVARTLFFFSGQPRMWTEIFEVTAVAAEKEKLVTFANAEGIRYKYMSMHREISLWADFVCLLRFIWLFAKERPYIVHGNTPKASMLSMFAAWMTRRPVRIYMCHGLRYQTTSGLLRKVLMFMENLSCSCANHVICVSEGVKEQLVKDGLCKPSKARVVRYGTAGGVDVNYFSREALDSSVDVRRLLGIELSDFVFCFVGRIVRDKGINELVHAINRLSAEDQSIHLILVGPLEEDLDPITDETKSIISGNIRIHAVGRQADVRPYLAASNAFVLPSYREGVGMVLLEANAMGVPCIASDIIGCRDVVESMVNGELIPSRDEMALYEKMKEWVDHPEIVDMMARKCREYVIVRYKKEDVAAAYFEEYKKIVENK